MNLLADAINQVAVLVEKAQATSNLLALPATTEEITELENCLSMKLPSELFDLLSTANGETPYANPKVPPQFVLQAQQTYLEDPSLFFDFPFYNTRSIAREYMLDRGIESGEGEYGVGIGSGAGVSVYPKGAIKDYERHALWIPIAGLEGDYFSIDLDPGEMGKRGQIILHGANAFVNIKISDDLLSFLQLLLSHYSNNRYIDNEDSFVNDTISRLREYD